MKKLSVLSLHLLLILQTAVSQTPHAIWEDQVNGGYRYVQLDAATGIKTVISTLPPITGFVAGDVSAVNSDSNHYHFIAQTFTNKVLATLDLSTGAIIHSVVMTNTVVGIEYNCADSTLYGILVNGNSYNFIKLDPVTGGLTNIAPIGNMQGYVGGSFSLDLMAQVYTYKVLTSTIFKLRSIDVKTGAVIHDNAFPDNVVGHKYSPTDNAVFGMWDNGGVYQLEKINYVTGTHTTVKTYTVITPGFYGESMSMNQNGDYTFRGFDAGNNPALFTLDCTTGAVLNYSPTTDNALGFEEAVCVTGSASVAQPARPGDSVCPNPTTGIINLRGPATLYNDLGIKLLELKTPTADLSQLPRGIYYVETSKKGHAFFTKLVLQ